MGISQTGSSAENMNSASFSVELDHRLVKQDKHSHTQSPGGGCLMTDERAVTQNRIKTRHQVGFEPNQKVDLRLFFKRRSGKFLKETKKKLRDCGGESCAKTKRGTQSCANKCGAKRICVIQVSRISARHALHK